jgi:hypothetical protein
MFHREYPDTRVRCPERFLTRPVIVSATTSNTSHSTRSITNGSRMLAVVQRAVSLTCQFSRLANRGSSKRYLHSEDAPKVG